VCSVVVSAESDEAAAELVAAKVEGEELAGLILVPAGVFLCELRTPDDEDDDNPANVSAAGLVLEPFDDLGDWLEAADEAPIEGVTATAATEAPPAAVEGGRDA
jgi:hypothetical protein